MGQIFRTTRAAALGAIGVSALAAAAISITSVALPDTALAAKAAKAKPAAAPASEADQKKADAAAARQAYDAGVKAYAGGKFQPASDLLSTALRGGGLSSSDMAKALYLRGVSYKRLNKPGLAISDLTSALWLKNGLGEADQKQAMAERSEAYRMAGLGDGNSGSDRVSVADPNPNPAGNTAAVPAEPAAAPAAAPSPAPKKSSKTAAAAPAPVEPVQVVTRQAPDSQSAIDAANARRNAAIPVEGGLYSAANPTLLSDAPKAAPAATAAPAPAPAPAPAAAAPAPASAAATQMAAAPTIAAPFAVAQPAKQSGPVLTAAPITGLPPAEIPTTQQNGPSTVAGFFSNLFGGSTSPATTTPQGSSAVTTASTTPAASASASSWSNATSVASGAKTAQVAPAAAKPAPGGKYKLHIAAVRSRAEAEALAQKLASQQGAALQSRIPVVDEAVIGSMGTFYRVRVGSYATAEEPRGVCNTLRSGGFDCLVVTN